MQQGILPSDIEQARVFKKRAAQYTMVGEQLYKRAFSRPLLKCIGTEDIQFILQEVHQGSCGSHIGGRSLARRILLVGYF